MRCFSYIFKKEVKNMIKSGKRKWTNRLVHPTIEITCVLSLLIKNTVPEHNICPDKYPEDFVRHMDEIWKKIPRLSPREFTMLRQIGLGHNDSRIARELYMSKHTVQTHIKSMRKKLRCDRNTLVMLMWVFPFLQCMTCDRYNSATQETRVRKSRTAMQQNDRNDIPVQNRNIGGEEGIRGSQETKEDQVCTALALM